MGAVILMIGVDNHEVTAVIVKIGPYVVEVAARMEYVAGTCVLEAVECLPYIVARWILVFIECAVDRE